MPGTNAEEIFEIVDETGRVIGTAPRKICHGDPSLLHQSIHVFVFNRAGNLFLQKRSMKKDSQPGKWDTSVGGHMAPGEKPLETAIRETGEELGFTPESAVFAYQFIWRSTFESELIRSFVVIYEGPFKLDPEEISEGRFWSPAEIEANLAGEIFTPQFRQEYPRMRDWMKNSGARSGAHLA
jgi:isopentenyldiphosphate isomerase